MLKNKEYGAKAGDYLIKWLVTVVILVDKSMPIVVALYNAIPCSQGGSWRGHSKTLLFTIGYGLSCRVPLAKLVEQDEDI